MERILEDAIQLEVNASLHVDDATANTCMALLRIWLKEKDVDAMIIQLDERSSTGYVCELIYNTDLAWCPYCKRDYEEVNE